MKIRDNKGSITVFVLVGLLFMTGFLIISFGSNINKSKSAKEQLDIISSTYSHGDTDADAYDRAYTAIRKRNAQKLNASSENQEDTSTLELTKTFDDTISNYRIYGNSVQNNTTGQAISPSNPIEIQSVGDKTNNLFNIETIETGKMLIKDSGNLYANTSFNTSDYIQINEDFTLSWESSSVYFQTMVCFYDKDKTFIEGLSTADYTYSRVFEVPENTCYVRFSYSLVVNGTPVTREKIQLEKGTVATEFEPYGKYKIPVKVSGKNLLDTRNAKGGTNNGITAVVNSDGSVTCTGTAQGVPTNIWLLGSYFNSTPLFILPEGEYNISDCSLYYYNGTGWIHSGSTAGSILVVTKEKYPNGFPVTAVRMPGAASGQDWNKTIYPMIEKGRTKTEWEPYAEPQIANIYLNEPLRKIGDYADYIDFKNQKVVRKIYEYTLNGTEEFTRTYGENLFDVQGMFFSNPFIVGYGLSNYYRYNSIQSGINANTVNGEFALQKNGSNLFFKDSNYSRSASFKENLRNLYLAGIPVKVDYVLTTPTEETIEIPELKSYEDCTKIEVLTEIEPSKIEVEYLGYTIE